ncbi:MAG: hypothetical protein F6K10_38590 [Moorea sp. SIO2B7]|nr:hypothetical protein [Moorena sp. SIO2B7]
MKKKFYQISLVSAFVFTLSSVSYSGLVAEARQVNQNTSSEFSPENYKKACVESYVADGLEKKEAQIWCDYKTECREHAKNLPEEDAEMLCTCTINEFQARYTTEEFKKITQEAKKDEEAEEKLIEVGEACFEKILYED